MISVKNLSKYYGNFHALKGISFEMKKGEILGFLGPNGAGKTTSMRVITTFIPFNDGEVTVGGYDVLDKPYEVRKLIGYLPETPPLYPELRVEEYLNFVGQLKGLTGNLKRRVASIIEKCGLEEKRKALIAHLSKGYRQRVGLAQALIHQPEILILDEPTSGLDPKQIVDIRDFIKLLGREHTILLSSHILSEVSAMCDRVMIIEHGEIIACGSQNEISEMVSPREIVRLRVSDPAGAEKFLAKTPDLKCRLEEGLLIVEGEFNDQKRAQLISTLVKNGFDLYDITRETMNLEQAFIELVRRKEKHV